MRILVFYGKGGIGKSTVVTNLSALFARQGKRVLQFGCDPKSDSCYSLVDGPIKTVMDEWIQWGESDLTLERCLMYGHEGVHCLEVGGPTPGTGCGGRGITKAFELVGDPDSLRERYDVVLFDVLGDVVCGGFSAPMRANYADEVYIVTSGELRALYAANNIAQAVKMYARNGIRMGGLIANLRGLDDEQARVDDLARSINTRVVHAIPRDQRVGDAEVARQPVVTFDPDCPASKAYGQLFDRLSNLGRDELTIPQPLSRQEFDERYHRTERC